MRDLRVLIAKNNEAAATERVLTPGEIELIKGDLNLILFAVTADARNNDGKVDRGAILGCLASIAEVLTYRTVNVRTFVWGDVVREAGVR